MWPVPTQRKRGVPICSSIFSVRPTGSKPIRCSFAASRFLPMSAPQNPARQTHLAGLTLYSVPIFFRSGLQGHPYTHTGRRSQRSNCHVYHLSGRRTECLSSCSAPSSRTQPSASVRTTAGRIPAADPQAVPSPMRALTLILSLFPSYVMTLSPRSHRPKFRDRRDGGRVER